MTFKHIDSLFFTTHHILLSDITILVDFYVQLSQHQASVQPWMSDLYHKPLSTSLTTTEHNQKKANQAFGANVFLL